jgi:hypothetical protein
MGHPRFWEVPKTAVMEDWTLLEARQMVEGFI